MTSDPTPPTEPALPTWEKCREAVRAGTATALQQALYSFHGDISPVLAGQLSAALAEQRAQAEAPLREELEKAARIHQNDVALLAKGDTELTTARAEIARLRKACAQQSDAVMQLLGKALGYPWFKDHADLFPGQTTEEHGICPGDHSAESMADEAAQRITTQAAEIARLEAKELAWKENARLYAELFDGANTQLSIARADITQLTHDAGKAQSIPPELSVALVGWWRARHHGGREDERNADEALSGAISSIIDILRSAPPTATGENGHG